MLFVHLVVAAVVCVLLGTVNAEAVVRGRVELGELPPAAISIRLDTNQYALVRKDGTFVFRHVAPGVHEMSVVDPIRQFSRLIVVVDDNEVTKIVELSPNPTPNQPPMKRQLSSLVFRPILLLDYFEKRQQMTLASVFANPMMLMMAFTLGMGLLMPKMMENIDPEELKQAQDQIAGRKPKQVKN
ncbi:hypothetical protein BASA81_015365 [Batrachochytrium salamandrivorans]|nr:hypothetical protein BASA81_015365 [Batrachochytrium salamandrivorans]